MTKLTLTEATLRKCEKWARDVDAYLNNPDVPILDRLKTELALFQRYQTMDSDFEHEQRLIDTIAELEGLAAEVAP